MSGFFKGISSVGASRPEPRGVTLWVKHHNRFCCDRLSTPGGFHAESMTWTLGEFLPEFDSLDRATEAAVKCARDWVRSGGGVHHFTWDIFFEWPGHFYGVVHLVQIRAGEIQVKTVKSNTLKGAVA